MRIWVKAQAAFTALILLMLLWAFLTAWDWPFQARLLPWAISIPTLALCLFQLVRDLSVAQRQMATDDWIGNLAKEGGVPVHVLVQRVGNICGWILGFFFSIWFIGFIISVPLFMWLYLTVQGREKWWVSLGCTSLALVFLLGLFHYIFYIPWPEGLINWPQEVVLELIGR